MDVQLIIVILVLSFKTVALEKGDPCIPANNSKCIPLSVCELISKTLSLYGSGTENNVQQGPCGHGTEPLVCCDILQLEKMYNSLLASTHPTPQTSEIISDFSDKSVCGLEANSLYKINGGRFAGLEEFPWIAALEYESVLTKQTQIRCGGSLITNRYVLTAAHCLEYAEFQLIKVWLGVTNITSDNNCLYQNGLAQCSNSIQKLKIEKVFPHEFYNGTHGNNDIGLIRLEKEIKFNDYIRPICLPSPHSAVPKIGLRLTVAGWGIADEHQIMSDVKLKVQFSVHPTSICAQMLKNQYKTVTSDQLCAGGDAGKASCLGDAGGALMGTFGEAQQWYQEGLVADGVRCDQNAHPGIYIRVAKYIDWIINITDEEKRHKTDKQQKDETNLHDINITDKNKINKTNTKKIDNTDEHVINKTSEQNIKDEHKINTTNEQKINVTDEQKINKRDEHKRNQKTKPKSFWERVDDFLDRIF